MRFAIAIPQRFPDGGFDPEAFRSYLARAAELGFESAWTMEQVFGGASQLSPLEVMTYAAACVPGLRLGCAVLVTTVHSPVHLAKAIASLDQLSRGRVEVGVAFGAGQPYPAFGIDPAGRATRFAEGVRLMKACWTEDEISFAGRFWQLDGARMVPKPFQKPYPPLWFGGSSPSALRRAARHGDGFFGAGSQTTAQFAGQVPVVRQALAESGRDPASFRIAKRVYVAVDDDPARARERVAAGLVGVYGEFGRRLAPVAVAGSPADCVRGLSEVAAAGAELILLNPLFDDAAQLERLAAEVIPGLA